MTGQAYAARSRPAYGLWACGAILTLAVIAVGAWAVFQRPAPDAQTVPRHRRTANLRPQPLKLPVAVGVEPSHISPDENTESDLRSQISALRTALEMEQSKSEECRANLEQSAAHYTALAGQYQNLRNAATSTLSDLPKLAPVAPIKRSYKPSFYSPDLVRYGDALQVRGQVYNGSDSRIEGRATAELLFNETVVESKEFDVAVDGDDHVDFAVNLYHQSYTLPQYGTVRARVRWVDGSLVSRP